MMPITAQDYLKTLANPNQRWGWFTIGGVSRRCVIQSEDHQDYYVRYFNDEEQLFEFAYVDKSKVTVDNEVEELAFWVLKNSKTGKYFSAASNPSSCPSIYSTRGKAKARQYGDYVIKKWVISERDD